MKYVAHGFALGSETITRVTVYVKGRSSKLKKLMLFMIVGGLFVMLTGVLAVDRANSQEISMEAEVVAILESELATQIASREDAQKIARMIIADGQKEVAHVYLAAHETIRGVGKNLAVVNDGISIGLLRNAPMCVSKLPIQGGLFQKQSTEKVVA